MKESIDFVTTLTSEGTLPVPAEILVQLEPTCELRVSLQRLDPQAAKPSPPAIDSGTRKLLLLMEYAADLGVPENP